MITIIVYITSYYWILVDFYILTYNVRGYDYISLEECLFPTKVLRRQITYISSPSNNNLTYDVCIPIIYATFSQKPKCIYQHFYKISENETRVSLFCKKKIPFPYNKRKGYSKKTCVLKETHNLNICRWENKVQLHNKSTSYAHSYFKWITSAPHLCLCINSNIRIYL